MIRDPSPRGLGPTGERITSKVTSKLQVTLPKALADAYGIRPGDEIAWVPSGSTVTVVPPNATPRHGLSREQREERFLAQQARIRHAADDAAFAERWRRALGDERSEPGEGAAARGWSRDDLYGDRGLR